MGNTRTLWGGWASGIFLLLVLACTIITPALAADSSDAARISTLTPVPDLNQTGLSLNNMTIPPQYQVTQTPVTVFKAEVTASSLPGPRDMAYGPRVIGFSMDPLAVISIIVILAIAACAWYLYSRRKKDGGSSP